MRNKILIPSAVVPNAYYLGPMGDPDPSDFINLETNRIPFKQSIVDLSWNTRDGGIDFVGYQRKRLEIGKFMT